MATYLAKERPEIECYIPQLPYTPELAIRQVETWLKEQYKVGHKVGLIGSSLGGYYATWLAEKYDLKAVLIKPSG